MIQWAALSSNSFTPQICIVGSGPAGFYTAQSILKNNKSVHVDIYEKLPAPYGLVRYGVAPDHPDVKNVIHTFEETANRRRCQFLGNVNVGKDISIDELRECYHAVILTYGAADDKLLEIPGEDAQNVLSAKSFVGWYNGLHEDAQLNPDLSCETAVIIGVGNVALDVSRILLTPVSLLEKTDICAHALEALRSSKVKQVYTIGRRGPLQVSFTIKEFREMIQLAGCRSHFNKDDFVGMKDVIGSLKRPRKRLTELLTNSALDGPSEKINDVIKNWHLKLLRTPLEVITNDEDDENRKVTGIRLGINKLESVSENAKCLPTGKTETLDCGLILRSTGYKSASIDHGIPFDDRNCIIPNNNGRVADRPGLYCSGWISTGPVGVILNTMSNSFQTGASVSEDLRNGVLGSGHKLGNEEICRIIGRKGVRPVFYEEWIRVNDEEVVRGEKVGKPREKIVKLREMLNIAWHNHV
ncbi:FDXR (predicted) [Pycnogonum litorale]